jgi:hypothetical protein
MVEFLESFYFRPAIRLDNGRAEAEKLIKKLRLMENHLEIEAIKVARQCDGKGWNLSGLKLARGLCETVV